MQRKLTQSDAVAFVQVNAKTWYIGIREEAPSRSVIPQDLDTIHPITLD